MAIVCAIVLAVALAGCAACIQSGSGNQTTPGVTSTPLPAIGSTINLTSKIDLTNVHWYKYQILPSGTPADLGYGVTTTGSTLTERWDFNVNYDGMMADEVTGTGNYSDNVYTANTISFLDHANHTKVLSGNLTVLKNGMFFYHGDLTPKILELEHLLDLTNSSYSGYNTVTYGGTETVTVPQGTYTAIKYMYNSTNNLTIYTDSDVPVPIKLVAVTPLGTIYDIELIGWG